MWPVTSPALQCLLLCVAVGGRSVAVDAQGDRERRLRARSPEAARLETEISWTWCRTAATATRASARAARRTPASSAQT
eukprot:scaffold1199_cov265-Pinguiococcus_pyrenoidosus.AAC.4